VIADRIRAELRTWTSDEDQSTTLNTNINNSALTFQVTPVRDLVLGVGAGIVEIDQELIFISNIATDGTCTVPPWGRGYRSTVAVSHSVGAQVRTRPPFPYSKIYDEMNTVLDRIFPDIYVIKHYNSTTTIPQITYDLPNDAQWVLKAEWQVPDGRNYWQQARHLRMSAGGRPTTTSDNNPDKGVTVDVADRMMPGRPIHFEYAAMPTDLTGVPGEDFETQTGLSSSIIDVVIWGAAASMAASLEAVRMQLATAEQQARGQYIQGGTALNTSKYFEDRYQLRLKEERESLQQLYPPAIQMVW